MLDNNINEYVRLIHDTAHKFGADLVGIANVDDLKRSPSHKISKKLSEFNGVGTGDAGGRQRGIVEWPAGAVSAIVIAVEHPYDKPELDWWETVEGAAGNTAGNRLLIKIISKLSAWLETEQGIRCFPSPYHIERGGVYMKDAAVLAGLGCIGKNNMLITPQYGPRLRLRALLTEAELPSAGVAKFYPCEDCTAPCQTVCPQDAFAEQLYAAKEYGLETLPGRTGVYSRVRCNQQMKRNELEAEVITTEENQNSPKKQVHYCRECELVCPIGSK